jgi:RNA-directed DNA polymerase
VSPANLNAAWKRVRNDRAEWLPGVPRRAMEGDLAYHLTRLREDLLAGRYRPAPMRHFTVAKGDGGQRVLSAQCLRDKLAQRAVLGVLTPHGEALFHNDSFGYRPRRGVEPAVERARERVRCGLPWLVDADIRAFFDRVPHKPLHRILRRRVRDRAMRRLIRRWLEAEAHRVAVLGPRRGIHQGAVLSPFLCNLYLHELDRTLARRNIPFVRYADDFLLFAPDRRTARRARRVAAKRLRQLGLRLHPRKTQVVRSSREVRFLGKRLPDTGA